MTTRFLFQITKFPTKLFNNLKPINYSDPLYLESRYRKEALRFEWYANYKDLKKFFITHISKSARILHIGNGTSSFIYLNHRFTYKNV